MREIKFRAWDKIGKKFLFPYPEGFHILGETTCFDLLMGQMYKDHPECRPTLMMLNDVEITQFTGLTDKNGKEIYEGDKIRDLLTDTIVTVEFIDGSFCAIGYEKFAVDLFGYLEESSSSTYVIGNIYETT